jgi:molybdopterin synthase catalytic subunit
MLKEAFGSNRFEMDVPAGTAVSVLLDLLKGEKPDIAAYLDHMIVAVNHNYAKKDRRLEDGDEVAIFPPVSGGISAATVTHVALSDSTIDVSRLIEAVSEPGAGAVVVFTGLVRDHNLGRQVDYLEYEAYAEMALPKLDQVVDEIRSRWPKLRRIALEHRVGHLELGEIAVVVAVGAPHRDDGAFEAARYAIDRIKEIVPIWKKEGWSDGEEWLEGEYHPKPNE